MLNHLLVYGSLRRDHSAERFMKRCTFDGEFRLPGFTMYQLGWFPGVVPDENNSLGIVCELYTLPKDKDFLQELDYYEGFAESNVGRSLFVRKEVQFGDKRAYLYVFNQSTESAFAKPIPSGDWNDRKK